MPVTTLAIGNKLPSDKVDWRTSLGRAIRDPDELISRLELPESLREGARRSAELFPLLVPESYLRRMHKGDATDPLLRQVLPLAAESLETAGFSPDPVHDLKARKAPGLLHKYEGRALLIATGTCAVHCRYCFRRHYPYKEEPRRREDWQPALQAITDDKSLSEIILSGGDPLVLSDAKLEDLISQLRAISHIQRIRIHTRLPIVLPDRVTPELLRILTDERDAICVMVVHANHPQELVDDCAEALRQLVRGGIPTLNQAVLLRGVNEDADVQQQLSERLLQLGVIPYYLHQLDRVQGAAHFEVPISEGVGLIETLRNRLPGYAVPRYVQEQPGAMSKTPVG